MGDVAYIGVDPGLVNMGVAIRCSSSIPDKVFVHHSEDAADKSVMSDVLRCRRLVCGVVHEVEDLLEGVCESCVVAIEGPSFNSRFGTRLIQTGMLHGFLYDAFANSWLRSVIITVPPKVLKKYATGGGTATKKQMAEAVRCLWFPNGDLPRGMKNSHSFDAYALSRIAEAVEVFKPVWVRASVDRNPILKHKGYEGYDSWFLGS